MKIFILMLALIPEFTYAQNSFPTGGTNPQWRVEKGNFFGSPRFADYFLGNDVVINGKHYQEIKAISPHSSSASIEGYVRNENKKVYIITFDPWNGGNLSNEKIMYDFSLEVNKKIYCAALSIENPTDSTLCWAVSTDSMIYNGIKRKTWNMLYSEKAPIIDPPRYVSTIWIEGIGSLTHPFFPLYCISEGCEASSSIVCFHESNVLKYLSPRYSSCDSLIRTDTKELITQSEVKLYPNLATYELTVENNGSSNLKIQISNSLGRLFITKQLNQGNNLIDISQLASGIYFASMSDGHKRRVEKFVKN